MPLLRQLAEHLISHINGRAGSKSRIQLLFQSLKFIIQLIIFIVAHDLSIFLLICPAGPVQQFHQLPHPLLLIFHFVLPMSHRMNLQEVRKALPAPHPSLFCIHLLSGFRA